MSNKLIKTTTYLNPSTGQISEKKQLVDMLLNDDGYLFWNKKASFRGFTNVPLPEEFTWSEKGRIDALRHYIVKDNQLLAYKSNGIVKPLDIDEMCKVLDMSTRQCKNLVNKMKRHHIIKEVSFAAIKYFAFNPIYGFKGKRLNINVYIMFQDELKNVLPEWVITELTKGIQELKPDIKVIK